MSFEDEPINVINAEGAPDFVTHEASALLAAAQAHFEAATGRQLSPSQVEMYLLETVAYMLTIRGGEEQAAFENCFVAYAEGDWLDRHGTDRSTPRLAAAAATTTMRFQSAEAAVSRIAIPAGTRVSDVSGQVQFLTLEAALIETGAAQVDVPAQATVPGVYANGFDAGRISTIVDPVTGIASAQNLTVTGGGANRETDDRYRARLALAFERIGDGLSQERYVSDVYAWNASCVDVAVTRPQPGHVDIYPLMGHGAPNAGELASLAEVFGESNTHQGDFIQVFAPTPRTFEVDLHLTLSQPDAADAAERAVQTVLDSWEQTLGGYIAPSELIRAARAVSGVIEADTGDLALELVPPTSWRQCTSLLVSVEVV